MSNGPSKQWALAVIAATTLLGACATTNAPEEDNYALFRELMPHSILVLPPVNESVNVGAPYSWVTTATMPIAEQGFYVFPVAIIDEFMKENGLPNPEDMHAAPLDKLGEIFGADAVLYVTLTEFGQKFELLSSTTRINAVAQLVDIGTGQVIWDGKLNYADSGNNGNQGGLLGALVNAAITQISESVNDSAHDASRLANWQLFQNSRKALLKGPLHPEFASQMQAAQIAAEEAAAATAAEGSASESAQ